MAAVFVYEGNYVPSSLQRQLHAAGVAVLGVTCTQDAGGVVTEVDVICEDGTDQATVDAAVAAYVYPEPLTPEQIEAQRDEAEYVRVANVNETDWIITPPSDTPASILVQINNNLPGWQTFRQDLRALPVQTIPLPADLVWPAHPLRPYPALTPPPDFVQ